MLADVIPPYVTELGERWEGGLGPNTPPDTLSDAARTLAPDLVVAGRGVGAVEPR